MKQFASSITTDIAPVRVWLWNRDGRCQRDFVSWILKSRLFVTNVNDILRPTAVRTILGGQSSKMKWPQFIGKICSLFFLSILQFYHRHCQETNNLWSVLSITAVTFIFRYILGRFNDMIRYKKLEGKETHQAKTQGQDRFMIFSFFFFFSFFHIITLKSSEP